MRLIDETISMELDGMTVHLRPSLRCALNITSSHGEPEEFVRQAHEGHFGLTHDLLRHGIADQSERKHALHWLENSPVPLRWKMWLLRPHLVKFTYLLCGIHESDQPETKSANVCAFERTLRSLFELSTGVLHWTPDVAWNATLREISHALEGWRRIQPGYEPPESEIREQRLSQKFDAVGFSALKAMGGA